MPFIPKKHKITLIKEINKEVKLFRVESKMNPLPGKFFEVSILGIGECPLASCSYNEKYLDLLVRNAGGVTSKLFELKKGDFIFIRGSYGKGFPIDSLKGRDLILVAGGTGIAPITSLIEYIEKNRNFFGEIWIYFGFRNENYILLKEKIKKWVKKFNLKVCLNESFSKIKDLNYKIGLVNEIIKKEKINLKNVHNTLALMCGPEIMMESVSNELNSFGLNDEQIYWSMERRMECGFGSCGRCLIQDVYVCKDGPVFRYDVIKPKLKNEGASNKYGG